MATEGTEGCRKHWLMEVRGEAFKIVGRIYDRLLLPETLASVQLWSESELLGLRVARMQADEPEVAIQDERMQQMLDMALSLMHFKLVYASGTLYGFPNKLAALLGTEEEQHELLVYLYRAWQADKACKNSRQRWCKAFYQRSPFRLQIMVDVVEELQRADWRITKALIAWAHEAFGGFCTTINEEGFAKHRGEELEHNKAHDMSSCDVWQTLSFRRVLQSSGFREIITDTTLDVPKLPDSLYHIQGRQASSDVLKALTGPLKWPSLTQLSLGALACELSLLVQNFEAGTMGQLSGTWRCCFLRQGLIVAHKFWNCECLSLGPWPSNCGALLLPLQRIHGGWTLLPATAQSVKWADIASHLGCKAKRNQRKQP